MKITKSGLLAAICMFSIFGCQTTEDGAQSVGDNEGAREQNVSFIDQGDGAVNTVGGCLDTEVLEERFIALVNAVRAEPQQCGDVTYPAVGAVSWSERIEAAALKHSEYLAESLSLSHVGSSGSNVGDRLSDEGYLWSSAAENVAFGYGTPEAVLQGWLASDDHCVNIMNSRVTEMAVSCVDSTENTPLSYWTQVFALPRR